MTDSKFVVVDAGGWLKFLGQGANADAFADDLKQPENLLIPMVVVYEVDKQLFQKRESSLANVFLCQALAFRVRLNTRRPRYLNPVFAP